MATPRCAMYSSDSAAQTLEWMNAIADFLRPFRSLIDAHVVNFFKDRLWEAVDVEWMDCLRKEPVENLLNIPSGVIMEHWPASLQKFVLTLKSLAISREQELPQKVFPKLNVTSLGSVIAQGMNAKKRHEVEILAAVVNTIANDIEAQMIIDVGAGQGYLAQVLSFEYQLSVTAIDASSHHSAVTSARAERIRKHYASKFRKAHNENKQFNVPWAVTSHVLSSSALSALSTCFLQKDRCEEITKMGKGLRLEDCEIDTPKGSSYNDQDAMPCLVLAGLHACGDLSVNMLRTFVECEQVKALVCIGCCYNLLSEEEFDSISTQCGFPMSNGAKTSGISLGKNARDLACQSAERWRNLCTGAALQNFELHIFRAAFQMVLDKYHPDIVNSSPSIGRQGKALRRQQMRRVLHSQFNAGGKSEVPAVTDKEHHQREAHASTVKSLEVEGLDKHKKDVVLEDHLCKDSASCSTTSSVLSCACGTECEETCFSEKYNKYVLFEEFSKSGLGRLGFELAHSIDLHRVWREAKPFFGTNPIVRRSFMNLLYWELVGPYWSLRAALGPLLETYILLDRLLFLQEQGSSMDVMMFPLFDPILSPRNISIFAKKTDLDTHGNLTCK